MMTESELRNAIRVGFRSLDEVAEAAIREQLLHPIDLEPNGVLQFLIWADDFGIQLLQTEETIVPDFALYDAVPKGLWEPAEDLGLDLSTMICEEIAPWLADRWEAAGGPGCIRPAYAFFHGTINEPRYDLEARRWCKVSEVWPDESPN